MTAAERLLLECIHVHERVLVLGATGWFGRTLLTMLGNFPQTQVLAVASRAYEIEVGGRVWAIQNWQPDRVQDFNPTLVLNFASLTRDRVAELGETQFREINRTLRDYFETAVNLDSVNAAVTVSSGAAVLEPEHSYGAHKAAEEAIAVAARREGRDVLIGRAYSVSGPQLRDRHKYAFSALADQARAGKVTVSASRPTYRRYVDCADFISVSVAAVKRGVARLIESGGELIEIGDLASRMAAAATPPASVQRSALITQEPSVYASDGTTWDAACDALDFEPLTLEQQIQLALESVLTEDRQQNSQARGGST